MGNIFVIRPPVFFNPGLGFKRTIYFLAQGAAKNVPFTLRDFLLKNIENEKFMNFKNERQKKRFPVFWPFFLLKIKKNKRYSQ